jgi:Inner membrane protein YgaP-like, transmembrane domain
MEVNVGGSERTIRVVIGLVLIALGLFHVLRGTGAIVGYIIGAIALITGLVRFCPAWKLFGINTSRAK